MHRTTKRAALAGAACLAIGLPAVALAANPVKGGQYSDQATSQFATVSKDGKSAKLMVSPGKCNHGIPLSATGKISSGQLTYDGMAKELGTQNGTAHLRLSGTFVNHKTLKWTARTRAGSCRATVQATLTRMSSSG